MSTIRGSIILLCCLSLSQVFAQDERTLEYLRQEEQRKRSEMMRHLDSGVYYMDNEEYILADSKFKYVLDNVRSVPSDLTFYFGKNSYYLKKYKQSIDWLNKYIELKGTSSQHYEEAADYLKRSEAEFVKEKASDSKKAEQVFSSSYDIDCGPSGKVSCPVCKGDHVITKRGIFGDEYKTCPYCNEHGILTCVEYNKLLRGELQQKQ
jgi:cell division protein FtsB